MAEMLKADCYSCGWGLIPTGSAGPARRDAAVCPPALSPLAACPSTLPQDFNKAAPGAILAGSAENRFTKISG